MTPTRGPITTHVLDLVHGRPAAGIAVDLEFQEAVGFVPLAKGVTNADGRITDLLPPGPPRVGVYCLTFHVEAYWRGFGVECFFPSPALVFIVRDAAQHYHVPLLTSPFTYSTYRGS